MLSFYEATILRLLTCMNTLIVIVFSGKDKKKKKKKKGREEGRGEKKGEKNKGRTDGGKPRKDAGEEL